MKDEDKSNLFWTELVLIVITKSNIGILRFFDLYHVKGMRVQSNCIESR